MRSSSLAADAYRRVPEMAEQDRRALLDEQELLNASIVDAREEAAAGELPAEDLARIEERDSARLLEVRSLLEALGPEPTPTAKVPTTVPKRSSRSTKTKVLGGLSALVLISGAIILIVALTSPPAPSAAAQQRVQLDRAASLVQTGKITDALRIYGRVLAADSTQPEALAQSGWLTFEAGAQANDAKVMAKGEALIRSALNVAPRFAAARLYLGVIDLVAAKDPNAALEQFQAFVDLQPSSYWLRVAQPYMEQAAAQANKPVPTPKP